MNNLLLGGSGLIGSSLGEAFLKQGDAVTSVGLTQAGHAVGAKAVAIDLYRDSCPQELLNDADNVFILIGQTHPGFDAAREKQVITHLAQSLQSARARVFYCSTVLVYGDTVSPANETTPCHPIGSYSIFKYEAEAILRQTLPPERLTIFRLANVYGSPKNKGFIGLVMNQVLQPHPSITIMGDGLQKRDYILIDDVIQAMVASGSASKRANILNVATGISHTLLDVIDLISTIAGREVNCNVTQKPTAEVQNSLIDTTQLRQIFSDHHVTPLKEGLTETLKRYQEAARNTN